MPTTPRSLLPYPAAADPADVPLDMQELALALDEIAYAQITASVTVPVVAEASAVTVVSAGAITYEAVPIMLEFFAQQFSVGAGGSIIVNLWDGAINLGFWGQFNVAGYRSATLQRRLTPTAGSHTYMVKAWAGGTAGSIAAGPGGAAGTIAPAFIRIVRA
jgi:hypothetical protein